MKSLVAGLGIALLAVVGSVVFLWPSQRTGFEPINYGRDACAHCRMHISQPGFAAELRDRNGVLTNALSGVVFIFLTAVTLIFLASIFLPGLFGR